MESPEYVELSRKILSAEWEYDIVTAGVCVFPLILMRSQKQLGLNPTQFLILLQLCDFWTEPYTNPSPSKKVLSERLNLSERQVQRYISELENTGFISRIVRHAENGGILTNEYDLSGLKKKLKLLAPVEI